jgi:hypothetical protein
MMTLMSTKENECINHLVSFAQHSDFRGIYGVIKIQNFLKGRTSRSRIWQMIEKNSSVGLSRLLYTMSDICKVSDAMRVVGKNVFRIF